MDISISSYHHPAAAPGIQSTLPSSAPFQCNFLFRPLPASFTMRPMAPLHHLWLERCLSTLPPLTLFFFSMFFFHQGRPQCQITETAHSRLPSPCFLLSSASIISFTCMSSFCTDQPMPSSPPVLMMPFKSDSLQLPLLSWTFRFPNLSLRRLARVTSLDASIHKPS